MRKFKYTTVCKIAKIGKKNKTRRKAQWHKERVGGKQKAYSLPRQANYKLKDEKRNSLISRFSPTATEALTSPDFMPQANSPEDRSDHGNICRCECVATSLLFLCLLFCCSCCLFVFCLFACLLELLLLLFFLLNCAFPDCCPFKSSHKNTFSMVSSRHVP